MKVKSLNEVTDNQIKEALGYLWVSGFIEEMTSDKRYYTEILCKAGADKLGFLLEK